MSLYADYIKEREGKDTVETADGFATYISHEDGMYIESIYVKPEQRKSGAAAKLADIITEIARAKQLKKLYGSVSPSAIGSTASLKVLLAYGFELHSAQPNFIVMKKDI